MDKINVEHMLAIEEPFIKAPLEQLKRIVRQAQKQAEREASQVSAALGSLAKSSGDMDGEEADAALGGLISRLGTLKRKLAEAKHEEAQLIRRSKQRAADLGELSGFESAGQAEFQRWSRARLDRVLIDYMLRTGNVNTAQKLAAANGLEHFADSSLFALVMATERELRDQHSCHGALQWCGENRSALRKLDSALEFELRLQEFVELARAGQTAAAIAYAKRHLTAWAPAQMPRIQRAMALLAFAPATTCAPYRAMFDEARWVQLAQAFRAVVFRLYSLPPQPLLHLLLQTGLSALKTPACVAADAAERNRNCPVCQTDTLGRLAQGLPLSHHVNSSLVCRISGDKMDENNPPMRLPNGYVYSLGALSDMAAKHGKIRCPRTDQIFSLSDAKKLFIS